LLTALTAPLAVASNLRNQTWLSAESLWRDAMAKSPLSPRPYQNLGVLYLHFNDLEGAIEVFGNLTEKLPAFVAGHANLGVAHLRAKNFAESITAFKAAKTLDPGVNNILNLIYALMESGDAGSAVIEARFCVEKAAQDSRCHYQLSRALQATGDREGARTTAATAVELAPDDEVIRKWNESLQN
jgi:tetratricopeptide (TPR) repeat protein